MKCHNVYTTDYLINLEAQAMRTGEWVDVNAAFVESVCAELHAADYHEVEAVLVALYSEGAEGEMTFGCAELLHFHYTGELAERGPRR